MLMRMPVRVAGRASEQKMTNAIRVGTCSWTDKTMVRAWYPKHVRTAADRLRYYASRFDTVEVDSTFYALPSEQNAALWVERTPAGFVFHVKAFGMMTRHGVKPEQLPPALRSQEEFALDRYGRIVRPSADLRATVFDWFAMALEPLRSTGRLGLVLLQFPPYFVASEAARAYVAHATELLRPDPVAIEFRHDSWVEPAELDTTLNFLKSIGGSYVCVDEPRIPGPTVLPPLTAVTARFAYVRFHGRNAATWHARTGSAADRFKYLYEAEELAEWREPILRLAGEAEHTFVMFNNCFADYAPTNAHQMLSLLDPKPEE
jgi:uncharacterized protein YecE (DUF72 family)